VPRRWPSGAVDFGRIRPKQQPWGRRQSCDQLAEPASVAGTGDTRQERRRRRMNALVRVIPRHLCVPKGSGALVRAVVARRQARYPVAAGGPSGVAWRSSPVLRPGPRLCCRAEPTPPGVGRVASRLVGEAQPAAAIAARGPGETTPPVLLAPRRRDSRDAVPKARRAPVAHQPPTNPGMADRAPGRQSDHPCDTRTRRK
jgi:hypothetical protein